MSQPPFILRVLLGVAVLGAAACTSSGRRDQSFGTDAGLGFVPQLFIPDAAGEDAGAPAGDLGGNDRFNSDGGNADALQAGGNPTDGSASAGG